MANVVDELKATLDELRLDDTHYIDLVIRRDGKQEVYDGGFVKRLAALVEAVEAYDRLFQAVDLELSVPIHDRQWKPLRDCYLNARAARAALALPPAGVAKGGGDD